MTLSGASGKTITIDDATADGTAAKAKAGDGADFYSLTFDPGVTELPVWGPAFTDGLDTLPACTRRLPAAKQDVRDVPWEQIERLFARSSWTMKNEVSGTMKNEVSGHFRSRGSLTRACYFPWRLASW